MGAHSTINITRTQARKIWVDARLDLVIKPLRAGLELQASMLSDKELEAAGDEAYDAQLLNVNIVGD